MSNKWRGLLRRYAPRNDRNMKIVYIAHPIAGDVHGNVERILKIVKKINLTKKDIVPFAPYIPDVLAMDDSVPEERERGIKNDIQILRSGIVDELWVYGERISGGVAAEIDLAFELNIPVVIMDANMFIPPAYNSKVISGY